MNFYLFFIRFLFEFYLIFIKFVFNFYLIFIHFLFEFYIEPLRKLIFHIPTKALNYDYTFNIGKYIFSRYDINNIIENDLIDKLSERIIVDDDEKETTNIYDEDDEIVDEPQCSSNVRKKPSHIKTHFLVVNNEWEFVTGIGIAPGFIQFLFDFY